VRQSRFGRGY